jgi:hypothetical protein
LTRFQNRPPESFHVRLVDSVLLHVEITDPNIRNVDCSSTRMFAKCSLDAHCIAITTRLANHDARARPSTTFGLLHSARSYRREILVRDDMLTCTLGWICQLVCFPCIMQSTHKFSHQRQYSSPNVQSMLFHHSVYETMRKAIALS